MKLTTIQRRLSKAVDALRFGEPVTHVYNPLDYAWEPHSRYLESYGQGKKEILLVGMNPGPFGMAQTGVPFGEIELVRDWLGISGKVRKPTNENPKRPIVGFDCDRREVSGQRLWGWAKERAKTPARFFRRVFIHNYCPLVFMEEGGRNRTPDKLPASERDPLYAVCDEALGQMVDTLGVKIVLGVGAFAEARAKEALADRPIKIARILHPSPASPVANRGWAEAADRQLEELGIRIP